MSSNVQNPPSEPHPDEVVFASEDEELQFAEETEPSQLQQSWKILIVDDDPEVHDVTKLLLNDVVFENKSLSFISAYSAQEARQQLQDHVDIAVILLDVVMETEHAGLKLIQYVREELGNSLIRIILRTGQPGRAPETIVVANYGIDDYKTKTELTSEKLFIVVITALRAFSTLMKMLEISQSLEQELMQYREAEQRTRDEQPLQKIDPLDRSLHGLPHPPLPSQQREKLEILGQLLTEVTHDIIDSPNAGALYTMHLITRIARMMLRMTDEHSAKLGLSQSKLAVLMYLGGEPELSASPSSLAEHCGISRAAMTGLLNGLEQEGYVERDSHPYDRRALTVKLTPKGQQFLGWLEPQDQSSIFTLADTLDEVERQKFVELAQKVLNLFGERSTEPLSE